MLDEQAPRSFQSILTLQPCDEVSLHEVIEITTRVCRVGVKDFASARRWEHFVRARHIYFYLAHKFTGKTFPQIAKLCGDRDHTTAVHGYKSVERDPGRYEPELSSVRQALGKAIGG
jgi:chromosomal replication initiation ATPase DnaA